MAWDLYVWHIDELKLRQMGILKLIILNTEGKLCKLLCSAEFGYGHSQIFEVKNCVTMTGAERKLG